MPASAVKSPSRSPDPASYMTDDELVGKFLSNVDGLLPKTAADRIAEQVMALEAVEDFGTIMRLAGKNGESR